MRCLRKFLPLLLLLSSCRLHAQQNAPKPLKPSDEVAAYTEPAADAFEVSDYQRALPLYQKGLKVAQERKDIIGEGIASNGIGLIFLETGKTQEGLEYAQRALSLFRQAKDRLGESQTLNTLAIFYHNTGQFTLAIRYYEQALPLAQQLDNRLTEATLLNNIGTAYGHLADAKKAMFYFQKALAMYEKLGNKKNKTGTLASIATTYVMMNQRDKALEAYLQVLSLTRETHNRQVEALTLSNIGLTYRDWDQPQKALEYYRQALPLFQQIGDTNRLANVFYNIGSVHSSLGDYHQAELALQQALALREQVRSGIGGSAENRQAYLTSVLSTYTRLLFAQVQNGETDRAFATLNKMKGRSLIEQAGRRSALSGVPDEAQSKLRDLRKETDRLSVRLAATNPRNGAQVTEIRTQLEAAEQSVRLEQDRLFSLYPGAAQKNSVRTAAADDIPAFLPVDSALLEFAVLKVMLGKQKLDQVLVFVATVENGKPAVTVHTLALQSDEIADTAEQLREACAHPKRAYRSLARKLGALLLPPDVLLRLHGKTRLIVCPDGETWTVPFAALLLPDGKHLLERFEIDYAYSATGAQAALAPALSTSQGMLVVANPDFGDTARFGANLPEQIAKGKERPLSDPARPISDPARPLFEPSRLASIMNRGKIKPLPGTQQEADALHQLYPDAKVITGREAQEAEIVKALPQYRYLHFATHGLFSDAAPLQSAIVLAQPPQGSSDDGFLTAREIYEMTLNAEMAVLSACETARGVNQNGEGVIGLTWALSAAGVPTQVVSQWKVSDAATPKLMERFYLNLKQNQGKGKALRNAALALMQDKAYRHPYYWAAFVLFGNWK